VGFQQIKLQAVEWMLGDPFLAVREGSLFITKPVTHVTKCILDARTTKVKTGGKQSLNSIQ
jgi:hypothetical protein